MSKSSYAIDEENFANKRRRFTLDSLVSLATVAESLPFTYTGADLYALCSDAMLKAITRSAQLVDQRLAAINEKRKANNQSILSVANYFDHHATDADTEVSVTSEDFTRAREEMAPSVSVDELRHYERVRDTFEGATRKSTTEVEQIKSPTKGHFRKEDGSAPKLAELMKYARENGGNDTFINGTKRPQSASGQTGHGLSDGDDDYVVRTDRLNLNNGAARPPSSRGKAKGKGKAREPPTVDGKANASIEDDLYD